MPVIVNNARFLGSLYLKRLQTINGEIITHGTSIKGLPPVPPCFLFHAYVALLCHCQDRASLLALDIGLCMTNALFRSLSISLNISECTVAGC